PYDSIHPWGCQYHFSYILEDLSVSTILFPLTYFPGDLGAGPRAGFRQKWLIPGKKPRRNIVAARPASRIGG
ncbi:MAG: hypothetical protein UIK34_07870, partial [Christensenellales bacterium]|nr:hypothetical protein [Christensenellales bacterium]